MKSSRGWRRAGSASAPEDQDGDGGRAKGRGSGTVGGEVIGEEAEMKEAGLFHRADESEGASEPADGGQGGENGH